MSELAIYSVKQNGGTPNKENIKIFSDLVYDNYYLYLEDLYLNLDKEEKFKTTGLLLDYSGLLRTTNINTIKSVLGDFPIFGMDESNTKMKIKPGFVLKLNLDFLFVFSTTAVIKQIRLLSSDLKLIDKINSLKKFLGDGVLPVDTYHNFEIFNMLNTLILAKLIQENGSGNLTNLFKNKCANIILYKNKNCLVNYVIDQQNGNKYESGCCWNGFTNRGLTSTGCDTIPADQNCFSSPFGCCPNGLALPTPQYLKKSDLKGSKCSTQLGLNSL